MCCLNCHSVTEGFIWATRSAVVGLQAFELVFNGDTHMQCCSGICSLTDFHLGDVTFEAVILKFDHKVPLVKRIIKLHTPLES